MQVRSLLIFTFMCSSLLMCCTTPRNTETATGGKELVEAIEADTSDIREEVSAGFVRLRDMDTTFRYDMRYATDHNFLKAKVYECDDCVIRKEVAEALINANDYYKRLGFRILLFDCYRPLDVQRQMWEVLPDSRYVANPERGSVHNRGGAVDLTLVDARGKILDMGTDFDHFGEEAHHAFMPLPRQVLDNRLLLKEGMIKHGFAPIRTEWWHYNFISTESFEVSNVKIRCL